MGVVLDDVKEIEFVVEHAHLHVVELRWIAFDCEFVAVFGEEIAHPL